MSSDGTTSWWPAAERRWHLCAISETGTLSAARYWVVVPMRYLRGLVLDCVCGASPDQLRPTWADFVTLWMFCCCHWRSEVLCVIVVGLLWLSVTRRHPLVSGADAVAAVGAGDGMRHKRDAVECRVVHVQRADDARRPGRHSPTDDSSWVVVGTSSSPVTWLRRLWARGWLTACRRRPSATVDRWCHYSPSLRLTTSPPTSLTMSAPSPPPCHVSHSRPSRCEAVSVIHSLQYDWVW